RRREKRRGRLWTCHAPVAESPSEEQAGARTGPVLCGGCVPQALAPPLARRFERCRAVGTPPASARDERPAALATPGMVLARTARATANSSRPLRRAITRNGFLPTLTGRDTTNRR